MSEHGPPWNRKVPPAGSPCGSVTCDPALPTPMVISAAGHLGHDSHRQRQDLIYHAEQPALSARLSDNSVRDHRHRHPRRPERIGRTSAGWPIAHAGHSRVLGFEAGNDRRKASRHGCGLTAIGRARRDHGVHKLRIDIDVARTKRWPILRIAIATATRV